MLGRHGQGQRKVLCFQKVGRHGSLLLRGESWCLVKGKCKKEKEMSDTGIKGRIGVSGGEPGGPGAAAGV